jgi:iron(III) transport system substrate-binding protein
MQGANSAEETAVRRAFLAGIAILLSSAAAQAQSGEQKAWDETLTAARKEGKVVVAGPPDTQVRQLLPAAFEARYGFKMEYITGRGSDQGAKLRREREAGIYSVDAVLAGSQTMFTVLHREKMLAPLKPELILPEVTDGKNWKRGSLWFPDPEQQYILRIFNTVREAFMINTDKVKPQDVRRYSDLLDPKWKGKISFLDPARSGTGSNQVAMIYEQFGEDFVKKLLVDQDPMISRERRQLTDGVLRGNYPISFGAEDGEMERLQAEGHPVKTIYSLEDMPGSISGGNMIGLMDKAPHPNAAKVFVNWMASKEGSEIYGRALKMVPVRIDIDAASFMPPEVIPQPGVKYFDVFDYNFTVTGKEEIRLRVKDVLRR